MSWSKVENYNNARKCFVLQMFSTTLFIPACNLRVVTGIGHHLEVRLLVPILSCYDKGRCWLPTQPEIGQLQGAHSELQ